MKKKNILVTGGLGRIGSIICPMLEEKYNVTIFESHRKTNENNARNIIYGDITSLEDIERACENIDAVVHLAAISDEDDFIEKILPTNIGGVYQLFEAIKNCGIKKVVFASTFQTIWNYPNSITINTKMPPRPFNMYACSKLFGEAVAKFYSEKFGISVACLRIGYFLNYDHDWLQDSEKSKGWCSPNDLLQMIVKSIECKDLKYEIFFAISDNDNAFLDIENAKTILGYQPIDGIKNNNGMLVHKNQNMFGKKSGWHFNC